MLRNHYRPKNSLHLKISKCRLESPILFYEVNVFSRTATWLGNREVGSSIDRVAETKTVNLKLPFRTSVDRYLANYEGADFVAV